MAVTGEPGGTPYDWYMRATELLDSGNPDAAIVLLEWVLAEDDSSAVLEAYGRALFDSRRYPEAVDVLTRLVERCPDADYGHYALGLSLWRLQRFPGARDHLAMAFVMRPERADYGSALSQVKATLRARIEGGLPLEGPVETGRAS
jgi:Flp pilus assembly protein TadD